MTYIINRACILELGELFSIVCR